MKVDCSKIMKIAYFGYDLMLDCFRALIAAGEDVSWVFLSKCDNEYDFNAALRREALARRIPVYEGKPTIDQISALQRRECELIVSAGYSWKIPIPSELLGINVHPTLLPEGRGPWPLPWIILFGAQSSGVTVHLMSNEFDRGDIIGQRIFTIRQKPTIAYLEQKLQKIAPRLLLDVVRNLPAALKSRRAQASGSYWPMPTEADRTLDWTKTVAELSTIIRAFGRYGCCALVQDEPWLITEAYTRSARHSLATGSVIHRNKTILVAVTDGFVVIKKWQHDY